MASPSNMQTKQWNRCLCVLMEAEGVRSPWNGHRTFTYMPCLAGTSPP